jgi:hypothetical protein
MARVCRAVNAAKHKSTHTFLYKEEAVDKPVGVAPPVDITGSGNDSGPQREKARNPEGSGQLGQ